MVARGGAWLHVVGHAQECGVRHGVRVGRYDDNIPFRQFQAAEKGSSSI